MGECVGGLWKVNCLKWLNRDVIRCSCNRAWLLSDLCPLYNLGNSNSEPLHIAAVSTLWIKITPTRSLSSIHSLYYNMFLRHYLTLISTAAYVTLASPTSVSGQITWSVADGRQMDPFPRNWSMVSPLHGFLFVLCENKRMTVGVDTYIKVI